MPPMSSSQRWLAFLPILTLLTPNIAAFRQLPLKLTTTTSPPPKSKWDFKPGPEVPGGSGFYFCTKSSSTDLMQIDHLEMYPSPPVIAEDLNIGIYGTFLKNITAKPLWNYEVYYSFADAEQNVTDYAIGTESFCELMDVIEQPNGRSNTCPPQKGAAFIGIAEWVPGRRHYALVGGTYVVEFDAKTQEGERIYCLTAKFHLEDEDY